MAVTCSTLTLDLLRAAHALAPACVKTTRVEAAIEPAVAPALQRLVALQRHAARALATALFAAEQEAEALQLLQLYFADSNASISPSLPSAASPSGNKVASGAAAPSGAATSSSPAVAAAGGSAVDASLFAAAVDCHLRLGRVDEAQRTLTAALQSPACSGAAAASLVRRFAAACLPIPERRAAVEAVAMEALTHAPACPELAETVAAALLGDGVSENIGGKNGVGNEDDAAGEVAVRVLAADDVQASIMQVCCCTTVLEVLHFRSDSLHP